MTEQETPGSQQAADLRTVPVPVDRLGWRRVAELTLAVAAGLLVADLATGVVSATRGLLVTLLVSLFLSFAIEPAVQFLAQRGMPRGLGTLLVFLAALLLLVGFVAAMVPLVLSQVRGLFEAGPSLLDGLARQARALPGSLGERAPELIRRQAQSLPSRLPDLAATLGRGALGVSTTVLGGVIQLLTTLLVTFYLTADGPRLRRALSSRLAPARQQELLAVWDLAIGRTGGYVYSRLLTAVASATFHTVVFLVIGIDYAVALGIWVGIVSSLVPVVGTYIAGALPLLVGLAASPVDALWVLIAIITYQQIENYLVAPRINAATMELHPAVAFLAVLAGAALLGPVGALLALPVTAVATALVSAYGQRHEVLDHELTEPDPAPSGSDGTPPGADRTRGTG